MPLQGLEELSFLLVETQIGLTYVDMWNTLPSSIFSKVPSGTLTERWQTGALAGGAYNMDAKSLMALQSTENGM